MKAAGHEVFTAYDGRTAIELAEQHRPDVVLLDIGMPEVSGYDVARAIRREAWGRPMRLIALTGWGQAEHRRRSIEVGFDDHLVKPVELDVLENVLQLGTAITHFRQRPTDQLALARLPQALDPNPTVARRL